MGELAILDPQSGRALRIVASNYIDAEAHQSGDVEPGGNICDDLLRSEFSRLKIEVAATDARRAGQPARGVVRGLHAQLARRVGVQQIVAQHAILHDYGA